jgi:hypothetical protein
MRRGAFRGASIHRTEIQLAGAARSEFGKIAARTTQTWRWRNNDGRWNHSYDFNTTYAIAMRHTSLRSTTICGSWPSSY